jgi:hypothetical protein
VASETIVLADGRQGEVVKNRISTDEELVSQNAHHFVEVAADVVDISDVKKASSFQSFVLGKDLRWGASVVRQRSHFG